MTAASPTPCPWCGSRRGVVHVHGHGQCAACGTNVEPCCAGDNPNAADTRRANGDADGAAPQLFPLLFEGLGGRDATVTTDALLFALANRLGSDLAEARLVLEAAERVGIVRTPRAGLHRLQPVEPLAPGD